METNEDAKQNQLTPFEQAIVKIDQRSDERLARVDERLERIVTLLATSIEHNVGQQPTHSFSEEESGEEEEVGDEEGEEEGDDEDEDKEEEGNDTFQTVVAILIAIISLIGGALAWRGSLVKVDDASIPGLSATLNSEVTHFMNNTALYKRYRAYTTYTLNDKLQQQIKLDLDKSSDSQKINLEQQQAETSNLMATSQMFFSSRYLNRDGSYNAERDLGEAWAQAAQSLDLNPKYYFDIAVVKQAKEIVLGGAFVWLAISMLFFTIAEMLNPSHQILRYSNAALGTIFLIVATVIFVMAEIS